MSYTFSDTLSGLEHVVKRIKQVSEATMKFLYTTLSNVSAFQISQFTLERRFGMKGGR